MATPEVDNLTVVVAEAMIISKVGTAAAVVAAGR